MKTLMLVRHASSGCDDMSLSDRFRPLDARGERELAWLLARGDGEWGGACPQQIVSSPALRALVTARALAAATGLNADRIRVDDRLYAGGSRRLLELVAGLDESHSQVAVVGHNPELSDLGRHFSAALSHLPSGGIAVLSFDADSWQEAVCRPATLESLDAPILSRAGLSAQVAARAVAMPE